MENEYRGLNSFLKYDVAQFNTIMHSRLNAHLCHHLLNVIIGGLHTEHQGPRKASQIH